MRDLKLITVFVILSLHIRLLPGLFNGSSVAWLLIFVSFFPLAHFLGKWSSGAGLAEMGFVRLRGWKRLLATGTAIGMVAWTALTVAELRLGSLHFIHWQPPLQIASLVLQAIVAALLGSAANDVLTRGLIFGHLRNRWPGAALVLLTTSVYIADDMWTEGWSMANNTFSALLGLAFSIALVRTKSLWMNTGIHAGLNFVYFLVYGFGESPVHQGIFLSRNNGQPAVPYLGIAGAAVILVLTLLLAPRKTAPPTITHTKADRTPHRQPA